MSVGYRVDVKVKGLSDDYLKKLGNLNLTLNVGFWDSKYADGTSVPYVAYLNEYGDHNPPRPFLKRTVERNRNKWTKLISTTLKTSGLSKKSVKLALDRTRIVFVGDVKKTIAEWPPSDPRYNKPSTIARKARRARGGKGLVPIDPTRALIDTGVMIASVKYEVVE